MREQAQEVFNRLADEDPGAPGRRGTVRGRRWVSPQLVVATIALALLAAPLAVSATGDVLREGVRNGTTASETEIIGKFNATTGPKGGYVTRQSNTQTGPNAGGGAIYGCRGAAGGTAGGSAPCLRASNLADGLAFEFASKNGPAGLLEVASPSDPPFATNGAGMVTNLNADKVDGLDAAELKGATGPAGPKGETGEKGDTGTYPTVLPSGQTLTGAWSNIGGASGSERIGSAISFPIPLASAPAGHFINSGGAPVPGCPGSAAAPAAAAGHLCIYEAQAVNVKLQSFEDPITGDTGGITRRFGINVVGRSSAAGNYLSSGSWAVTAP